MYRRRTRYSKKLIAMREAKKRKRLDGECGFYHTLPNLRRTVLIIDYDFGMVIHRMDFYKTNRVDCYRIEADGRPWKDRAGWSKGLEGIRKSFPRVGAT